MPRLRTFFARLFGIFRRERFEREFQSESSLCFDWSVRRRVLRARTSRIGYRSDDCAP
jgi:hypothetical protein